MRLYFLLVFFTVNVFLQSVLISKIDSVSNIAIDSAHNRILFFYQNHIKEYNLKNSQTALLEFNYPSGFIPSRFKPVAVGSTLFMVSSDGGVVYRIEDDSITRIDNSFEHRMQTGSILFPYKETIYRYGGYGFWSARNFFIYFDHNTHEWEVNDLVRSKDIPDGTFGGDFVLDGDQIYLFGGSKIDPYKPLERIENDELWNFDFKNNSWTFLGRHKRFLKRTSAIKYGKKLLYILENNIAEIDVLNNKVVFYRHNFLSPKLDNLFPSFYLNGKFYCFVNKRGKVSLQVMPRESFLAKKTGETIFYTNAQFWGKRSLVIILVLLLVFLLWWYIHKYRQSLNKIMLLENGVRFKKRYVEFDAESMMIIKKLLKEKDVSSKDLLQIVEKDIFSPAHNERLKVQKINDINLKMKALLGINYNLISSGKSLTDRRIRIYQIKKELFLKSK